MKKVLIGLGISLVLLLIIFLALPQSAKDYANYFRIKRSDPLTYSQIMACREASVITDTTSRRPLTYADILEECAEYEYWTYDEQENSDGTITKVITGNGSKVTLAYGDAGDTGMLQNAKLCLMFVLDGRGGYNLNLYVNNKLVSEKNRNLILKKMCQLARERS